MIYFAIPGDLAAPTGGYVYARRIIAAWAGQGLGCMTLPLSARFPRPAPEDLAEARYRLGGLLDGVLIDGLAYGAFDAATAALIGPNACVLLHHPLCDETGLDEDEAARAFQTERAALAHARRVVATSPATARDLTARFGVDPARLHVAEPGLEARDPAPLAGDPPRVLAVGSVTPRKGYIDLVRALADCSGLAWECEIVGTLDRDADEVARVRAAIAEAGLDGRIRLAGSVTAPAMKAVYARADLFVSPSYHEGYGMAVAEAMAHGLPVLSTPAGALRETAPCARFFATGDVAALATALRDLLRDPAARRALGAESRRVARTRPDWDETARLVAAAVRA